MTPTQVRMARAALAWTHRDLAEAAKVGTRTVFHLEAGRNLRPDTLQRIAGAFDSAGIKFTSERDTVAVHLKRA